MAGAVWLLCLAMLRVEDILPPIGVAGLSHWLDHAQRLDITASPALGAATNPAMPPIRAIRLTGPQARPATRMGFPAALRSARPTEPPMNPMNRTSTLFRGLAAATALTFAGRDQRQRLHRHLPEERRRYLRARTHARVRHPGGDRFCRRAARLQLYGLDAAGRRQEVDDQVRRARRHRIRQPRHHGRHQREGPRDRHLLFPDLCRVHADDAAEPGQVDVVDRLLQLDPDPVRERGRGARRDRERRGDRGADADPRLAAGSAAVPLDRQRQGRQEPRHRAHRRQAGALRQSRSASSPTRRASTGT